MAKDIKSFKYSTRFSSFARVMSGDDNTPKLATASIRELSKLLKPEIGELIEKNSDVLLICSNLILLDSINLNGDAVSFEDMVSIYENFRWKFMDADHNRENILGCIYDSGFSEFPSSKIISLDEAKKSSSPIQLVIAGLLWKLVCPEICSFLMENSDERSPDYGKISTSFELLFDNYDICIGKNGNRSIKDADIIKVGDPRFEKFDKLLICNGGAGKLGNDIIGRILIGEVMPVGAGLVTKPASGLKGVLVINDKKDLIDDTKVVDNQSVAAPFKDGNVELPNNDSRTPVTNHERLEPKATKEFLKNAPQSGVGHILQTSYIEQLKKEPESGMGYHICDVEMNSGKILQAIAIYNCDTITAEIDINDIKSIKLHKKIENNENNQINNINNQLNSVNANINNKIDTLSKQIIMPKITDLKQLEALWPEMQKQEAVASFSSVREFIEGEMARLSEDFAKKTAEKENAIKLIEANKIEAEQKSKELEGAVDKLNKHVEQLKAEEHVRKAGEKFNERMAGVDATFDLDEDTRAMLASEVKNMPCDSEADDMAYAAWIDKHKKLMKEKTHEFKNAQKEKADASKKLLEDKLAKAGVKATFDEKTLDVKEVVASLKDNNDAVIPNTVTAINSESLKDKFINAFKTGMTINGKSAGDLVNEHKARQ